MVQKNHDGNFSYVSEGAPSFFWLKCNTSLLECFLGGTFLNPQTDCCDFFTRFMKQAYARQQADAQNQSNK